MKQVISALMKSSSWKQSALFFTYDEGGGYFDHMPPPQVDAYGHSSVLKFIERRFGLPSLASINHQFDNRTPGNNNDAAHGQTYGPPAPPRDGLSQIGDFYEVF